MKRIILIFILVTFTRSYSQKNIPKRDILSMDDISIVYASPRLMINVKTNKSGHFQIWKGNEMVLNASGIANGEELFPVSKGKYKFILFYEDGKSKTKYFRI
jgi:hypothetical protein